MLAINHENCNALSSSGLMIDHEHQLLRVFYMLTLSSTYC